jgi:bifunctional non-homologous end joining protein LigD
MIFDLDPPSDDFAPVRDVARRLRDLLEELDLNSWLMLTGSRGAHVVVPLRRGPAFDEVRSLAQNIAGHLADARPEEITVAQRKKKRGDRVFLDTARNAYGQTTVAPYAVRPRPEATVAAPLEWDELAASDLTSSRYTIKNIFRRLSQKEDPWSDIGRAGVSLGGAADKLERFREEN